MHRAYYCVLGMDSVGCSVLQDREDVLTCLVTGNLQPIGWAKMEALGIKDLFSQPYFGGFGSDYCDPDNSDQSWKDRAELVKIAAQKAEKHFPGDKISCTCIAILKVESLGTGHI